MSTTTSNMSLTIPSVGDTDYPTSVSDSLTILDSHTHASGSGVQIPTGGIADSAVTRTKLASVGQQSSSSSGIFITTSSTYVDVTNLSISITTTGRPVVITLIPDGTSSSAYVTISDNGGSNYDCNLKIVRDATDISVHRIGIQSGRDQVPIPPGAIYMIDTPSAGTYTYKVQAVSNAFTPPNPDSQVINCILIAYEL